MNIRSKFNKYWRSFIHSVYPWHCKVCAKRCESSAEQGICELCQPQLPFCNQTCNQTCNRCGAPLSTVSLGTHTICGQCLSQPPFYDHVYAAFWYREPIDQLISELKYQKRWENLSCLMSLFTQCCPPIPNLAQILGMPSHPRRVRERGFNVINQCVRAWHSEYHFDYSLTTLARTRYTPVQTAKKRDQRRRNVRNVFAVRKALKSDHIILFDDVMTTGASANECAKVLKQAGAKHVQVWCLARAHRDWNMCLNQP